MLRFFLRQRCLGVFYHILCSALVQLLSENCVLKRVLLIVLCPQASPFESKPSTYSSAKPSSPEAAASSAAVDENQDMEQPGTPVPSEDPEASDNGTLLSKSPTLFETIAESNKVL